MWASQLLTLEKFISYTFLISHFDNTPGFAGINGRVEVVMFNCPQWGISAQKITVITSTSFSGPVSILGVYIPSITSCNSLVRVCIPHITTITPLIVLLITYDQDSNWVHLAEVTVFENDASCPPDGGTTVATSPLTTDATTYTTNSSTSMPPLLSGKTTRVQNVLWASSAMPPSCTYALRGYTVLVDSLVWGSLRSSNYYNTCACTFINRCICHTIN